jgi:hypothetical protein
MAFINSLLKENSEVLESNALPRVENPTINSQSDSHLTHFSLCNLAAHVLLKIVIWSADPSKEPPPPPHLPSPTYKADSDPYKFMMEGTVA